jgi:hypothetical protein
VIASHRLAKPIVLTNGGAMPAYRTSIATLDVPSDWRDQSIVAFRLPPAPGGSDASFVMTRDMDKGATPFDDYVEKQVATVARSLPDYVELKRDRFTVHDREAAWLEFRWTNERTTMQLRQVYFDCGPFATIFTLTATPGDIDHHDVEWRRVMSSVAFDPPPSAPAFP